MNLFRNFKKIILIILLLASQNAISGITSLIDGISSAVSEKLSEKGIKPYIIPLDQGRMLDSERFEEIDVGLTKEQIIYLIGKPPLESPFIENQWNYIYFNNTDVKKQKTLSIHFKNEKVFEILINNISYKKLGLEEYNQRVSENAPVNKIERTEQVSYGPIIVNAASNNLVSSVNDVCNVNDFKTFADVKTLNNADETSLEIRADNQSQTEDKFTAEGNAEAERVNDFLKADTISYNTNAKDLIASGNVKYFNKDISIYSNNATYKNKLDEINFSKAKYYKSDKSASGNAEEIFIKKNKDIILKNGTYTACSLNDPDWELTSTTTELYNDIDRGHAYNMILKYKNVPVFYSPFVSFPLSDKRQSGLLTPSFSTDSGSTSFSLPYYFNLAENYDATAVITSISDRGILLDNEFRHLGNGSSSLLNLSFLENDDEHGGDRYLYSFSDERELFNNVQSSRTASQGTTMYSSISYSRVSDLEYFDDFGDSLSTTSQSSVKRDIRLYGEKYFKGGIIDYEISSLSYQPSQPGVSSQYKTSPSIKLNINNFSQNEAVRYNLKTSIQEFTHKDNSKTEGTRYLAYPSIEIPIRTEGWELVPKLGVRYIDYNLNNNSSSKSKTTPIASLRGKLYLEKNVGNKLYTIEPEAYLLYIPVGNQDANPIFDSGISAFKYSLFAENRFYGEDRLNDAKQMTLALTHRIIDEDSGEELFTGTLGQIIYFDDRDVHLVSNKKSHSDASNIIGLVNAKVSDYSSLSIGAVFNPHAGHGMRNTARYRYDASTDSRNKLFNADYRFNRGDEEEIDLSGVYSFNKKLSFVGKYNYSFSNSRSNVEDLIDTMFGIEHNSCCYALKVVVRNYWTGIRKDNALFFEFLPKGLTSSNNTTSSLLREGVPGYQDKVKYE
jgi:LPS-assembly protein